MSSQIISLNLFVPAGTSINIGTEEGYLYLDGWDCFIVHPNNNDKIKLFLLGDNIWLVGNESVCDVDVCVIAVNRNSNLRVVNIPVLNPLEQIELSDRINLTFPTDLWYCYSLEPQSMYLVASDGKWNVKSTGHYPIYNNKIIAFPITH